MADDGDRNFRKGASGALLDEYERAAAEFKGVLNSVSSVEFGQAVDPETPDENCRSIQTIAAHVISAGYCYADSLREHFGQARSEHAGGPPELAETAAGIDAMVNYTVRTFEDRRDISDKEVSAVTLRTVWGADWGMEQLLEHAIVHFLRHRRQIERFLATLRSEE